MTTNEELLKKLDEDWQYLQEFLIVPENDYDDEVQSRCLKTINAALKAARDMIPRGIEAEWVDGDEIEWWTLTPDKILEKLREDLG